MKRVRLSESLKFAMSEHDASAPLASTMTAKMDAARALRRIFDLCFVLSTLKRRKNKRIVDHHDLSSRLLKSLPQSVGMKSMFVPHECAE